MPHVLFVYDHPDSLGALAQDAREAVYREYEALAEIPDMAGHRLQPGAPGTTLTITKEHQQPRLEPVVASGVRIVGFYIVATDDTDHAIELAARIPAARHGGAIQIHRLAGE